MMELRKGKIRVCKNGARVEQENLETKLALVICQSTRNHEMNTTMMMMMTTIR